MDLNQAFVGSGVVQSDDKKTSGETTVTPPSTPPHSASIPPQPTPNTSDDQTPSGATQNTPLHIQYPTPPGIELSERFPGMVKPLAEELVYEWQAGSRPFKKHTRQFYVTMITIVVLLSAIGIFAGQILIVAVVLSVAFLVYVLSAVPPHQIMYRITTYGIRLEDKLYPWEGMGRFWFDKKYDQKIVHLETIQFPNRLTLVLSEPEQEEDLDAILSEILLHQKPPLTFTEKAAKWLQDKFPLELET